MQGEDGKYYIVSTGDGVIPLAMTSAAHDTGPCVRALVDYKPGVILNANSDYLSWQDYLKTWCDVTGQPYGGKFASHLYCALSSTILQG